MTEGIKGKIVVITGAGSGLGAETARHLVKVGAMVVLGARRIDRLEALADELGLGRDAIVKTDVTDREQVKALVDHAVKAHGRIDVILNNAGFMPLSSLELPTITRAERNPGRQLRALRALCDEPARGRGRQRDPVPSHAAGIVTEGVPSAGSNAGSSAEAEARYHAQRGDAAMAA